MVFCDSSKNPKPFEIKQNLKWSFLLFEYVVGFLDKSSEVEDYSLAIVHVAYEFFNECT